MNINELAADELEAMVQAHQRWLATLYQMTRTKSVRKAIDDTRDELGLLSAALDRKTFTLTADPVHV